MKTPHSHDNSAPPDNGIKASPAKMDTAFAVNQRKKQTENPLTPLHKNSLSLPNDLLILSVGG